MMATFLRTNLESSILFMQQEHAVTLKALHEEIAKLQKKCTELSLQLAMGDLARDDASSSLRTSKLEEELILIKKENQEMEKELKSKDAELQDTRKRLAMLENEKEFQLKMKTRQISSLELEIENRAKTISDLMAELHCMKLKEAESKLATSRTPTSAKCTSKRPERSTLNDSSLSVLHISGEKMGQPVQTRANMSSNSPTVSYILRNRAKKFAANAGSTSGSEDGPMFDKAEHENGSSSSSSSPRGPTVVAPLPPKDAAPKLRRRTSMKTSVAVNEKGNGDRLARSAGTNRLLSGRRINAVEEVVPDPAPFLTAAKSPSVVKPKSFNRRPKVLPPIPSDRNSQSSKITCSDSTESSVDIENPALKSNELPRLAKSRMEMMAAVEVLSLDKADQLEVRQHTTKYNSTANCN